MGTRSDDEQDAFDALELLRSAGLALDLLSDAQRGVLAVLTPEEVRTLSSVKQRLDAAEPEVVGHDVKLF